MARKDAQLARDVVLSLIVLEPRHGWALQEELSPNGDIGRAWTLSKQLVYRAIDTLETDGLVKRAAPKDGGGADRVVVTPTAKGKRATDSWLNSPVEHLRDVRTELVLKVMMRNRFQLPQKEFLKRQRDHFAPLIQAIETSKDSSPVGLWRKESATAVMRYLSELDKKS